MAFLRKAPKQIRAVLRNGLRAFTAERDRLTDIILSNDECMFEEEELALMDLPQLKKIAALATPYEDEREDEDFDESLYDFSGAAGSYRPRVNKEEVGHLEIPSDEHFFRNDKKSDDDQDE